MLPVVDTPVVDTVGHEVLLTRLEDQSLDPGKLQQEASLSLRHRLVLAQLCLKRGHRLRPPVQLVGPGMEAIEKTLKNGGGGKARWRDFKWCSEMVARKNRFR